jgi:hypothetical protein
MAALSSTTAKPAATVTVARVGGLSAMELYNNLFWDYLLIDTRATNDYGMAHIKSSHNCPPVCHAIVSMWKLSMVWYGDNGS